MRHHHEPVQAAIVDDRGTYGRLRRHAWGQSINGAGVDYATV